MQNIVISTIRTIVPTIVGMFLTWVAAVALQYLGVELDPNLMEQFGAMLTGLIVTLTTGAVYVLFRWLERVVDPRFGWLLGYPMQPVYTDERPGRHREELVL